MAINIVVCCALVASALSCVGLLLDTGAFQWPSVLWGSSACLAGIGMRSPFSASRIWRILSGMERSGIGFPLGAKLKRRT